MMPSGTPALLGDTAIETKAGAATVKVAEPEIDPEAAVIVVVPIATLLASPPFTVATVVALELQVTELVRF